MIVACNTNKKLSHTQTLIRDDVRILTTAEINKNFTTNCKEEIDLLSAFSLIANDSTYRLSTDSSLMAVGKFTNSVESSTRLKIGNHRIFYANGQTKSQGEYTIGTYTDCCTGGFCCEYYSYKIGKWIYYNKNGTIKAIANYNPFPYKSSTSCGSDEITYHKIESIKFFNEETRTDKELEFEMSNELLWEESYGEFVVQKYIPLKDSLIIKTNTRYGVEH